jgi:hypothetical protein
MASQREDLFLAAKEKLLWEWGYEGTRPRDIQEIVRSGGGVTDR